VAYKMEYEGDNEGQKAQIYDVEDEITGDIEDENGTIFLRRFQVELRNGMSISAIFETKDRVKSLIQYVFEHAYDAVDEHVAPTTTPLIYDHRSYIFHFDIYWFIHMMIEWIAVENGVDRGDVERFVVRNMITVEPKFLHNIRFLLLCVLGMRYGILSHSATISLNQRPKNGVVGYENAAFYVDTVYHFPRRNEYFLLKRNGIKLSVAQKIVSGSTLQAVLELSMDVGAQQAAIGQKYCAQYADRSRPYYHFHFPTLLGGGRERVG